MSNLKDFDWTGFWNDVDYAFESYIGKPVTDKDIKDAESELGYRLPAAYIELLNNHNGGVLNKNCFINNDGECVYVTGIYGIDRDKKNSIFGEFGNEFWISKWEYPPIGVVVADTISGGHDMIFLDYRECGPTGESKVVRVDQEGDYSITLLADSFGDFIKQLYISIEDITDEEFQALSDEDKVKLINEQEDLDIDRAMELLTNIGIDNLSPILLSTLGRIYNNNDRVAEAVELFERINKLDAEQLEISEDNYPSYSAVHWVFNKKSYSKENFSKEFNQILEEYAEYGAKESALALLEEPEILVTYEAWIESENQLYHNERLDDEELLEEEKEDNMWQVEIMAHITADNGKYFTGEELTFKLQNLMANKELGDHVFYEGIEYEGHECEGHGLIDNEAGIPVFYVCCGS
ncbi:SMI1/KNR4 family protein [Veillonella parvula]|uniref:SMI1/KNR4 family protein n=1 Tax=Veillonella parvula TaxID=29466 RepID=UPI00288AFC7E|nr:SMI1/KNR4 family protein [Veillonella parvula]